MGYKKLFLLYPYDKTITGGGRSRINNRRMTPSGWVALPRWVLPQRRTVDLWEFKSKAVSTSQHHLERGGVGPGANTMIVHHQIKGALLKRHYSKMLQIVGSPKKILSSNKGHGAPNKESYIQQKEHYSRCQNSKWSHTHLLEDGASSIKSAFKNAAAKRGGTGSPSDHRVMRTSRLGITPAVL